MKLFLIKVNLFRLTLIFTFQLLTFCIYSQNKPWLLELNQFKSGKSFNRLTQLNNNSYIVLLSEVNEFGKENFYVQNIDNLTGVIKSEYKIGSGGLVWFSEALHTIGNSAIIIFSVYDTTIIDSGLRILSIIVDSSGREKSRNISQFEIVTDGFVQIKSSNYNDSSVVVLIQQVSDQFKHEAKDTFHFLRLDYTGQIISHKKHYFGDYKRNAVYSICKEWNSDSMLVIGNDRRLKLSYNFEYTDYSNGFIPDYFAAENHGVIKALSDGVILQYVMSVSFESSLVRSNLIKLNHQAKKITNFKVSESSDIEHFSNFKSLIDFKDPKHIYFAGNRGFGIRQPLPETTFFIEKVDSNFNKLWKKLFIGVNNYNALVSGLEADRSGGLAIIMSKRNFETNDFKSFLVKIDENGNEVLTSNSTPMLLSSLVVYPNPSNGTLNVEFKNLSENILIEFYNLEGRQVFCDYLDGNSGICSLNLSWLNSGQYKYKIYNQEGSLLDIGLWLKI